MEPIKQKKLTEEANKLFLEIEKNSVSNKNTIALIKKAILRGYQLGYDKFFVPMCDKCNYRSATCFGPGAFCDECSMEEHDEE